MQDSQFIFTTPFNVNVAEVKGQEKVFMEGLISTTDKDLVNDIVTKKCLESMQQQILERSIKLDIEHEAFRGESVEQKEINKTLIPAGKIIDATVVQTENGFGLRVKSELNNFRGDFEKVKGNVIERYLDAYSIAYIPTKTALKDVNGEEVRLLDDVRLLNVALTGNPINTFAQNRDVVMKSIDAVEEYKNEKKDNPELENKLEVKGRSKQATQNRNQALNEDEDDEDEKKKVKKKNHIHESDKLNNRRLNMSEDKESETTEEAPEAEAEAPAEEAPEETKDEEPAEEAEATEEATEESDTESEIKAIKEELAEIKALLKKPVHKAHATPQVKDMASTQKEMSPLDAIK